MRCITHGRLCLVLKAPCDSSPLCCLRTKSQMNKNERKRYEPYPPGGIWSTSYVCPVWRKYMKPGCQSIEMDFLTLWIEESLLT
jgi:hypothetical protein